MVGGAILDVPSSELPGHGSGLSHDFSIDWGEFGPLKVWPINIEGVFFSSVLESEKFSRTSLFFVWVDVSGDIGQGLNSDGLGDVLIDKGIGVAGCGGVVI